MLDRKHIKKEIFGMQVNEAMGRNAATMRDALYANSTIEGQTSMNDSKDFLYNFTELNTKDGVEGFFARNGFELFDYTPNLPLFNFFWAGQVPVRYGGGYAEQVSAFRLNFQLGQGRITGTKSNERFLTDVTESKITVPLYPFQYATKVTTLELMKSDHINYDILGFRIEALRLTYQREVELMAFLGNEGINDIKRTDDEFVAGLLNQKTSGKNFGALIETLDKNWDEMDVNDFVKAFVDVANKIKRLNQFTADKFPNTVLFPPTIMSKLLNASVVGALDNATGTGVITNYYDYLERVLTTIFRQRVSIKENPYIDPDSLNEDTTTPIKAGGEFGRIVFYRNDESVMRFHITLPLTGSSFYRTEQGWLQDYVSILGPMIMIYPTIVYLDNVAPTPPVED